MTEESMIEEAMVDYSIIDAGIATVTLNRPERNNAWNPVMEGQYYGHLKAADADDRARVVIVTGAGKSFCPGVDSGRLDQIAGKPFELSGRPSPTTPLSIRKPIIAAVNGGCAGMGLVQAMMCDIRFASRRAKFSTAFSRRGLAGEYGITYILPRVVGFTKAMDLLLSGRVFGAEEALDLGLINRVVDDDELIDATREYAREMAQNCSPMSLALIRHQMWTSLDQTLTENLADGYRAMGLAIEGDDFREGIDSLLQKRAAAFAPLGDQLEPSSITGTSITGTSIESAFETLWERGNA